MPHSLDKLGVDVTSTDTTAQFALGSRTNTSDGGTYVYVEADAAIAAYAACIVEEDFGATESTTTNVTATEPNKILIPQAAIASGSFGWALESGPGSVLAAANCAADVKLYTTATAGVLDDATSSVHVIQGLRLTAANGGSQAAVACFATVPMAANAQDTEA